MPKVEQHESLHMLLAACTVPCEEADDTVNRLIMDDELDDPRSCMRSAA
jgi:hypothetical protein